MKVLLFGKNGQVGWELQRALACVGDVVALDWDSTELSADFTRPENLAATVRSVRPDFVVNAAAHTAVDKAESEPELARTINALAPGILARECARQGCTLIHYSTDYVFDGSGGTARHEDDPTGPLGVYGRTKLQGEELIRDSGCHHVILRTSWVYGTHGANFVRTMLRVAAERDQLKVIDDQIGAPTGADLLADLTAHVIRRMQDDTGVTGTYHAVASGETSWYHYARYVIERARASGHPVKVAPDDILAVPTSAYPTPAARPLNSRLATSKLRGVFDLVLPPWQSGVERVLSEILAR